MQKELLFKQKKRKYTKRATVQAEEEEIYKKSYCSSRRRGNIQKELLFKQKKRNYIITVLFHGNFTIVW